MTFCPLEGQTVEGKRDYNFWSRRWTMNAPLTVSDSSRSVLFPNRASLNNHVDRGVRPRSRLLRKTTRIAAIAYRQIFPAG